MRHIFYAIQHRTSGQRTHYYRQCHETHDNWTDKPHEADLFGTAADALTFMLMIGKDEDEPVSAANLSIVHITSYWEALP